MNTPTPRTIDDVCHHPPGSFAKYVIEQELSEATVANEAARAVNVQFRKELNEARTRGDTYGQKYAACVLEREKLKAELRQMSVCLDASNAARSMLGNERDTLRKMVDAFAECGDCGDEWLMADYRELPHVLERKTK